MAAKQKSAKVLRQEQQLRAITKIFDRLGIKVRREKLASGPSFRVKSGDCLFVGDRVVFVDKRLPAAQQLSVLFDYIVEFASPDLLPEELEILPETVRSLVESRLVTAAA